MADAEKRIGLDSHVVDVQDAVNNPAAWQEIVEDADIHVNHTHFPDEWRNRVKKPLRIVWVSHGTPEHVFAGAVDDGQKGYGHGDGFMLMQYWLNVADARVTFWPRHQWIFEKMVAKGTPIECIPLGVDLDFWGEGKSAGHYRGKPAVFTAENPAQIKWPLDLFLMWPYVRDEIPEAVLHASRIGQDLHRWFFPLANANGTSYGGHIHPFSYDANSLRNIFKSVDYYIGLVRYGDHNRIMLEAAAAGTKTISYAGNVYADYWLPEGDQRATAAELVRVLKGEVEPRAKEPVPSFLDTAKAMQTIYEGIL